MTKESLLSKFKIHYEYTEDYIDVLSFFKKLRKKATTQPK